MKALAKITHRNHVLGRLVQAGEVVDLPQEVVAKNPSLYDYASGSDERELMSKEEALKIIVDKKLARRDEIENMSLKQIREMAREAK